MTEPSLWLTAGIALFGVLAMLLLLARGARAVGVGARPGRRLAVEEAVALDTRRRLLLVRCDGRHLLLVSGGGETSVVGWVPEPREGAAP